MTTFRANLAVNAFKAFETDSKTSEARANVRFIANSARRSYEREIADGKYRQGGNYKGPKRGGPNAGPNGFEVSAEGDLDGDGKTSLFTRTGKIVGGKIVLDDDVFASDPNE